MTWYIPVCSEFCCKIMGRCSWSLKGGCCCINRVLAALMLYLLCVEVLRCVCRGWCCLQVSTCLASIAQGVHTKSRAWVARPHAAQVNTGGHNLRWAADRNIYLGTLHCIVLAARNIKSMTLLQTKCIARPPLGHVLHLHAHTIAEAMRQLPVALLAGVACLSWKLHPPPHRLGTLNT